MDSRKLLRTILIIVIAGAAISGTTDNMSQQYAEKALTRALATFTVARTLNGVISVAQGTEVAVEPGGVGVILTPGQVLDPVNDLIERFSSVMLVAASSLGLQLMLLRITSSWVVTAVLIGLLALWLVSVWSQRLQGNKYASLTLRLSMMLVFVRFAIPVVIICTNFLFSAFLLTDQETATAALEATSTRLNEVNTQSEDATSPDEVPSQSNGQAPPEPSGDSLKETLASAYESLPSIAEVGSQMKSSTQEYISNVSDWFGSISVSTRMAQLKASAAEATSHIVDLIVIFVLQTIIFPLGFLWLFVEVLKAGATRSISALGVGP